MKRTHALLLCGLVMALACGEAVTTPTDIAPDPFLSMMPAADVCGATSVTLLAGQSTDVGAVTMSNDDANLYVTLATTGGWSMTAAHVAVAASPDGFPTNKAGNPVVGQFPFSADLAEGTTDYTVSVSLAELGVAEGATVYVAAQADVTDGLSAEGAWGAGTRFVPKGNWATYSEHAVAGCAIDVLILSNYDGDNSYVSGMLAPLMPRVNFHTLNVRLTTPTQEFLSGFRAVLLFENGLFFNAFNVGNALAEYVQRGGNVVFGTFYWQDRSDNAVYRQRGWGALEAVDPFLGPRGSEYNADSMDPGSIVAHPLTAGVESLWVSDYHGGVVAKPGTTVVASWSDGVPLIGFVTLGDGQRLVAVSTFPAHPWWSPVTGDFWRIWTNAIEWAGAGSVPAPVAPSLVAPMTFAAPVVDFDAESAPRIGGTSGSSN